MVDQWLTSPWRSIKANLKGSHLCWRFNFKAAWKWTLPSMWCSMNTSSFRTSSLCFRGRPPCWELTTGFEMASMTASRIWRRVILVTSRGRRPLVCTKFAIVWASSAANVMRNTGPLLRAVLFCVPLRLFAGLRRRIWHGEAGRGSHLRRHCDRLVLSGLLHPWRRCGHKPLMIGTPTWLRAFLRRIVAPAGGRYACNLRRGEWRRLRRAIRRRTGRSALSAAVVRWRARRRKGM